MAEPRPKSGPLQIHVAYSFDRLLESKLAQAYDILVPRRERPVGGRVKEFDDEDDGNLRAGLVRAAARGEHDREPDGVADRVRPGPRSGGAQRVGDLLAKVADAFPEFAQAFRGEVAKSISFTVDIAETRTLHLTSGSIESLGTCLIHVEDAKRLSSWYPVSSGSQEFDTRGRYPKHSV